MIQLKVEVYSGMDKNLLIQLKVEVYSGMDMNLEDEWDNEDISVDRWLEFIKSLPYVVNAEWAGSVLGMPNYTLITFASEAHKSWFILRWS